MLAQQITEKEYLQQTLFEHVGLIRKDLEIEYNRELKPIRARSESNSMRRARLEAASRIKSRSEIAKPSEITEAEELWMKESGESVNASS